MSPRRLVAGLLLAGLTAGSPVAARAATPVRIGTAAGVAIPANYLGLAFEYQDGLTYFAPGGAPNPAIEQLVRNLDPGGQPIIRVGGHSGDQAYVPAPGVQARPGLQFALGTPFTGALARFVHDLDGRLILGINLEANDQRLARSEATALVAGVGRPWVRALQLGNEPSLYGAYAWYRDANHRRVFSRGPDWSVPEYIRQYSTVAGALPKLPLAGPDLGDLSWMGQLAQILNRGPAIGEVTFHSYAGSACRGQPHDVYYPAIPNLLNPLTSRGLANSMRGYLAIARRHRLGFRVDEFNSYACGGRRGVSNSFASALWIMDALFAMADAGVDGVNVQTFRGAWYQLFAAGGRGVRVFPDYYGLLMFAQAAPVGSRILRADTPATAEPWLRVWATRASDGTLRVLLLNDSPSAGHTVEVELPRALASRPGLLARLQAPSVAATDGVTFAGRSFGSRTQTGQLDGLPQLESAVPRAGLDRVSLPAGSAALLSVR